MNRDSQLATATSSGIPALLTEGQLLERLFLTVPEVAFLMRVSKRTVWRLMADPKSNFPKPLHVRGRTLLRRDHVVRYLEAQ